MPACFAIIWNDDQSYSKPKMEKLSPLAARQRRAEPVDLQQHQRKHHMNMDDEGYLTSCRFIAGGFPVIYGTGSIADPAHGRAVQVRRDHGASGVVVITALPISTRIRRRCWTIPRAAGTSTFRSWSTTATWFTGYGQPARGQDAGRRGAS